MGQTVLSAVASGLALAGVLAIAGVAAGRFARGMPHLGMPAVAAGVAVLAGRLTAVPAVVTVALVAGAATALGGLAWVLDRRAREVDAPVWPPALLPEVAVLALGLAAASLLRPSTAIELPLGPLGGLATNTGAVIAFAGGIIGAVAWSTPPIRQRPLLAWILAIVITAVVLAVGAGAIAVGGQVSVPAFGIADVVGLALRAAAVGVVARRGLVPAIAAAVLLGVGESLLRTELSTGDAAVLPAVALLVWGLWSTTRAPAVRSA